MTSLPILLLLWWRRGLPESPRWLESRGRISAAEAVMTTIEEEIVQTHRQALPQPEPMPASDSTEQGGSAWNNIAALLAPPMARIVVMT
jgi:putative MFS transporter